MEEIFLRLWEDKFLFGTFRFLLGTFAVSESCSFREENDFLFIRFIPL